MPDLKDASPTYRVLVYAGRICCAIVTVFCLFVMWSTLREGLFATADPPGGFEENDPRLLEDELAFSILDKFQGGYWEFAGAPQSIGARQLTDGELEPFLRGPVPNDAVGEPPSKLVQNDSIQSALLDFAEQLGPGEQLDDHHTLHILTQSDAAFAVILQSQADNRIVVAYRACWRVGNNQWSAMEAFPNQIGEPVSEFEFDSPPLLPLPDDARRIAIRRDETGQIVGELAAYETQSPLQAWKADGWRCEQVGQPGHWICRRKSRSYVALVLPTPGAPGGTTLIADAN